MTQGNQSGAAIKAPETRAEFDGLVLRRSELREQLRAMEERRLQISAQVPISDANQRGVLNQRVAALDGRISSVEREVMQLDEVISNSIGNMASEQPTPFPIPPPSPDHFPGVTVFPGGSGPSFGDVTAVVFGEALAFVLIGLAVWRYTLHRFEKRILGKAGDPGQVARLQQSVDSIAVEVERISENQRYVTKLIAEKSPEVGSGAKP